MLTQADIDALPFTWVKRPIELNDKILINGTPFIGGDVHLGYYCEIYDKGGIVVIESGTDIGSWSSVNCGDSHRRVLGLSDKIDVRPIIIEKNVFVGSHCFIGGGTRIGHHSVIAAGTIIIGKTVPPYSLVWGAHPCRIKKGHYRGKAKRSVE